MSLIELASTVLLAVSLFFFTAGTIGLVRLPDLHSRLHALTKADNVGLGFTSSPFFSRRRAGRRASSSC